MIDKPSSKEEEYFAEKEAKRRKTMEKRKEEEKKVAERQKIKELHYMKCPKCGMDLEEIPYFDLKIDRCTECNGVWLDHGELEAVTRHQEPGFFKNLFTFARDGKHSGD